ncbi:DUF3105 domain-containing protein [Deinococcus cellulosilyticus]|uniref:DUF3105 domain-containing protein n=1 Tax=Deinococcus cellulosilyticus (strain DSM 18568 / NBRC 106333 / KACC 11606 / 5516J-15) TaxID=1223518 RepID=A0A511N2L9_DEIC1|nr:DUF3105 domain-containing protein [Deinococcus cellulosilyticus]GEM46708.1 hypothetical protein DC3_23430 [Deinococcus cellulosilyticus NBRC 106333 = KACC 11606]
MPTRTPPTSPKRNPLPLALITLTVLGTLTYLLWPKPSGPTLETLAAENQPALEHTQKHADNGRTHLEAGQTHNYNEDHPTSGPHSQTWVNPGFYTTPQKKEELVHALEHGSVIVHYGTLTEPTQQTLKKWAGTHKGMWDGLLVVPGENLNGKILLQAWAKSLTLNTEDLGAAAAFIDAHRGRGPENPVR